MTSVLSGGICTVGDCDRDAHARGYCATHYSRWWKHGDPSATMLRRKADPAYVGPTTRCSIAGCERVARARGWCTLHWDRWRRHGDPTYSVLRRADGTQTTSQRFWARVDVGLCWEWDGATNCGYGLFRVGGRSVRAHRWAYEALVGPVDTGLQLDHLCRNRRCVNPDHLEPVTPAENTRRAQLARLW